MNKEKDKTSYEESLNRHLLTQQTTMPIFRIRRPIEEVKSIITQAYTNEVLNRGNVAEFDEFLYGIVDTISNYITDTENSKKAGMIFVGGTGNGKTTMAKALKKVIHAYAEMGEFGDYKKYYHPKFVNARMISDYFVKGNADELMYSQVLIVDDLGVEATQEVVYGNIISPIRMLFESRYDNRLYTIITTNLDAEQLKEKYGIRITDRFKEMLCKINFGTNNSFRKQ